jgi:hypothetical protein
MWRRLTPKHIGVLVRGRQGRPCITQSTPASLTQKSKQHLALTDPFSRSSNVKVSLPVSQSSMLFYLVGSRSSKGNVSTSLWVDIYTFDSPPPGNND